MSGGEGKETEQIRLILSMWIANSKILCPLIGGSVIFLIQITLFLTKEVVIGEMQDRKSYFKLLEGL